MGYVERHLLPDERVLYKTRVHWIVFVGPVTIVAVGLVVTWLLRAIERPAWSWMVGAAIAFVGLVWLLARVIEVQTSEFAVTTTRLILKVGLVWRYTTELLLSKVETIGVEQSLLKLEGMDNELAAKLAEGGVKTRDDLADLAVDELSEMTGIDEERAKGLIMAARAHWFEAEGSPEVKEAQ